MSIKNVDRHGLGNLKHDPVKPLDRVKLPPFILYIGALSCIIYFAMMARDKEELEFQELAKKNLLLAVKKTQERIEYKQDEITPAEELTMKTS